MARYRKCLIVEYGEYHNHCPCHKLALAVVQRALLDTQARQLNSCRTVSTAIEDVCAAPDETEYTFFWWLSCVFADPHGVLLACQEAVRSGNAKGALRDLSRKNRVARSECNRSAKKLCA